MGTFINQFRRICGPETQSSVSVSASKTDYSSINFLSPSEDDTADSTSSGDDPYHTSTDSARKKDASLVRKFLTTSDAPHLNTKALIQKLDEVAKAVDLDVSNILKDQMKDPVLGTVRSWIRKNTPLYTKLPEIQQYKGLLRYCQEFDRLLVEEGQLLCYNEPSDNLEEENLRICLPLSVFFAFFRLGHYNEMGGHMGATKTYANAKRFYNLPGMFDWMCALTADCLTCQKIKPKPKHRNEVPLEEWQNETVPFLTVHIDHK